MATGKPQEQERDVAPGVGASSSARPASSPGRSPTLVAVALAALALLPLLGKSGIWDPYELDAADLARRIAIHAFGGRGLDLAGAEGAMPTLTDLKMGELGFTSMALGFRLFGLHDWAGRLPLALWGIASALVVYEFLARHADRRTGLYGVAILVTMPLYVMQARTMLGDIVTMAALTIAFCGLAGGLLSPARVGRLAWLGVGAAGLLAGYLSRGLLIGVAIPALGIGLTWLVMRTSGTTSEGGASAAVAPAPDRRDGRGSAAPSGVVRPGTRVDGTDLVGAAALVVGLAAASRGIQLLATHSPSDPLLRDLGFALLRKPPVESTFDLTLRQLGHALFPWSAFLPFAIGRLFYVPAGIDGNGSAARREVGLRVALLVTLGVAYGVFALLAPYAGALPFSGPALLAAVAALAVRDLERGAPSSRALAVGCCVLTFVLYRDFVLDPSKALSVFSVDKPAFPKSFEAEAAAAMRVVAIAFAVLVAIAWVEEQPSDVERRPRAWARRLVSGYRDGVAALARIWSGNLLFVLIVFEAALIGLGAMIFIGKRIGLAAVTKMSNNLATYGLNAWWVLPLCCALAPALLLALRDGFRLAVARASVPRAFGTLLAGFISGFALSVWYYPALAAQLSPKEVFESYASLRKPGEPLAVLGVRSRAAAYYQGGDVTSFADASRAFGWLTEPAPRSDGERTPSERRWLVVKADDLPKLNSLHRKRYQRNLPVLDGRSSQILLASNDLGGRRNESWLATMVLDEPAAPANRLDAMLEDQLEVLGWDIADADGAVVSSVVPQKTYHLRTYFRVQRSISGSWKMFVHIDGFQRRYNGDHAVLEGRYPMALWQPGDLVVDDHEFRLEANFTPGDYTLYFGLFSGETRLQVTRGSANEDRIIGGPIRVR